MLDRQSPLSLKNRTTGKGKPRSASRRTKGNGSPLIPVSSLHAVGSLFHCKPFIVEELVFREDLSEMMADLCAFLKEEGKRFRAAGNDELARIAGTRYHGGVVALTKRVPFPRASAQAVSAWAKEGHPMLIFAGDANPIDLAALARTSAYFGVEKFVFGGLSQELRPSESLYRLSRGAFDMVDANRVDEVAVFIESVRKYYFVIGSSFEGAPLPEPMAICPPGDEGKPVAIVIGGEDTGLTEELETLCSAIVSIPGSGAVDRLSLAAEASLLLQRYLVEGE